MKTQIKGTKNKTKNALTKILCSALIRVGQLYQELLGRENRNLPQERKPISCKENIAIYDFTLPLAQVILQIVDSSKSSSNTYNLNFIQAISGKSHHFNQCRKCIINIIL